MHNQDNEFSPGDSDYEFNTHLSLAHRCDCDSCTELSKSMIIIKNWIKKNPYKEGLRGHHYTIIFEETKNLLLLEDPKCTIDSLRSDLFALVEWEGHKSMDSMKIILKLLNHLNYNLFLLLVLRIF